MSSCCPKACGPRGDVLPTLGTEEPADSSPRPHYSCGKPDSEEEVVATENVRTSGKSSEQGLAVNENTPEGANTKPEEEDEVEEDKPAEDKQKRKAIEHSSLFNIADTTSGHGLKIISDALQDPIISDIRSLKLSPNKPPRGEALQQATESQELYDDNADRASS